MEYPPSDHHGGSVVEMSTPGDNRQEVSWWLSGRVSATGCLPWCLHGKKSAKRDKPCVLVVDCQPYEATLVAQW